MAITAGPEGALLRFTHEEGGDPADEARLFCAEHFSEVLLIRVRVGVRVGLGLELGFGLVFSANPNLARDLQAAAAKTAVPAKASEVPKSWTGTVGPLLTSVG